MRRNKWRKGRRRRRRRRISSSIIMLIGWRDKVSPGTRYCSGEVNMSRSDVVTNGFPVCVSFVRVHPMLSPSIMIDMHSPLLVSLLRTKLTAIL